MSGHGHIVPNADGRLEACGGPRRCRVCAAELIDLQASARRTPPKVRDQLRLTAHDLFAGKQIAMSGMHSQVICSLLAGVDEIDRLQARVTDLEAQLADAVHRNRQNPDT